MGFFKDQEKVLAAAHHYHSSFVGHFNCPYVGFGNCAFYLHIILIKSFCGGPGGSFFKKRPLAAGGKV
jgi:hypothetical protein